jgi:D-alanine-D-alanine ligase
MTRTVTDIAQDITPAKRVANLDITVLAGGPSDEREVSLQSGRMVRDALKRLGHHAIMLDIGPDDLAALDVPADVVFIALHGAFGEDGAVQRILDDRDIRYTGTGAVASALAIDKIQTKAKLIENDIPTPQFDLIKEARIETACENLELPVVVKPRASGSSVDTFTIRERSALEPALRRVCDRYGAALVERCVVGPELTVGVLGDRALPVCQIRTHREFYDYEAKYIDDDTEYLFDIDLPEELLEDIQDMSLRAHRAVGCRHFSRVDWMVDGVTSRPFALEVNTIPGLTSHSLLPKAAAEAGLSFDEMCQAIIDLAHRREDV